MKALRTIRLDASDTFVFERAAMPGEWAVSGAFVFAQVDPATLTGKTRAAFRGGLLGIDSLGWSTLAQIVEATEAERASAVELLARRLFEHFGAPDLAVARTAAQEEIDFAASLSHHPSGTLAAVSRTLEAGSIREAFRSLRPAEKKSPSGYAFLQATDEDRDAEEIDLAGLAKRAPQ
jgi:Family of unknown function (DUF6505)